MEFKLLCLKNIFDEDNIADIAEMETLKTLGFEFSETEKEDGTKSYILQDGNTINLNSLDDLLCIIDKIGSDIIMDKKSIWISNDYYSEE